MKKTGRFAIAILVAATWISDPAEAVIVNYTAPDYSDGDLTNSTVWAGDGGNIISNAATDGVVLYSADVQWVDNVFNEPITMASPGDRMTLAQKFKYNATEQFTSGTGGLTSLIFFDNSTVSANTIRVALRRGSTDKLFLFLQYGNTVSSPYMDEITAGVTNGVGESDWLDFRATLQKNYGTDDWTLVATVTNLTTGAEVLSHDFGAFEPKAALQDDDIMYGGINSTRSDSVCKANNRMVGSFEVASSFITPPAPTEVIVQWNNAGETNIVFDNSISFKDWVSTSYEAHQGFDGGTNVYYPDASTNRTPGVNATASNTGTVIIRDGGNGADAIELGRGAGDEYEGMLVWEDFLGTNTTLASYSINIYGTGKGYTNGVIRFLMQKGSGEWYASETNNLPKGQLLLSDIDAAAMTWYEFSPLVDGKATIGSVATPDMTDVSTVGYYFDLGAGGAYYATRCFGFSVRASVGEVRSDNVFAYDFKGWNSETAFSDAPGWDSLNQWGWGFVNSNATGNALVHRPSSTNYTAAKRGWNWRGVMYTNGLPHQLDAGDEIEFSVNAKMFVRDNLSNLTLADFFFTTNGTSLAENTSPYAESIQSFGTYPDGQLGFRINQGSWNNSGAWPDGGLTIGLDPAAPSTPSGSMNLNDIGVTNLNNPGSDYETDELVYTYSALKTTNAGVWDVSFILSDANGAVLKTINQSSWTNEALYNATNIYFGMYADQNFGTEEGLEIQNMNCRVILGPEVEEVIVGWDKFIIDYPGIGSETDNPDNDALDNWSEYIFGGVPTNGNDIGTQPTFDGSTGDYTFYTVNTERELQALVLTKENLILDQWETNSVIDVNAGADDGTFYVNSVNFDTASSTNQLFMKLIIEQQP
ncbi:hypothetical protein [Pontiella agarivorans]|uniref:Uncharacterized protein n=1 Tax=Pontiella agarivorans TaxID=3038953 RepID=A0ABU5N262_9BACT|nr:hypothetical protein [Pontiella agarivorans]MDZ8120540.1 hypothetical protein [Pontiella agarivorans]